MEELKKLIWMAEEEGYSGDTGMKAGIRTIGSHCAPVCSGGDDMFGLPSGYLPYGIW